MIQIHLFIIYKNTCLYFECIYQLGSWGPGGKMGHLLVLGSDWLVE